MKALTCTLLSTFLLVAGLAWSSDGHALTDEEHDHEASFSIQIDDPDDERHDDPACDHHCHAGAHLIALPTSGVSEFIPSPGSLSGQPSLDINPPHKESPYRPPSS